METLGLTSGAEQSSLLAADGKIGFAIQELPRNSALWNYSKERDVSVFEILMLVCFGAAWPFSIWKSWLSRSNAGKSCRFLSVIFAGYIFGTIHKALYHPDPVIYLYILNGVMVLADILIYIRNRRFKAQVP
jgi:hypothetical protein